MTACSIANKTDPLIELFNTLYKPHPWHGIAPGEPEKLPEHVTAFIEAVPGDVVKFEVEKSSGYLLVDRPHKFSSVCPTLYGFVPQTYCGERVAARANERIPKSMGTVLGDGDPIDICVLSSRTITHGDILVKCRLIGGFRMIDGGEADDKLIAVIDGDPAWGHWREITDIPIPQLDMMRHYFLTYKAKPEADLSKPLDSAGAAALTSGKEESVSGQGCVEIPEIYDAEEARHVLSLSIEDYNAKFGRLKHNFFVALTDVLSTGLNQASAPGTPERNELMGSHHLASYYYSQAQGKGEGSPSSSVDPAALGAAKSFADGAPAPDT